MFALPPKQGSIGTYMSPAERRGGFFYLVGVKGEMDTPGEWHVDSAAKELSVRLAEGVTPDTVSIELKRRKLAFDLSKHSHVQVNGFDVLGASLDLTDSAHCLVRDIRATWIAHTRGGATGYNLGENLGIMVGGHHNTIRDSEIAYSAGNGIKLSGSRHAVVNCWIHHTDYTGSYDAPIKVWGREMLISHNTIHDTGRDCLQPSGQAHVIQFNDIHNMGRIAHDLGASYVCAADGGGTEFRYNWCHDNLAHGTRMGIYLDNFTSNYFVYRNVVWNIRGCDIRLNRPSLHNIVVNNTMMGNTGNWGRWQTDWMYGCAYVNNAVTGTIAPHAQAAFVANSFKVPTAELNPKTFQSYQDGAKTGTVVPGISGEAPGIGAYEPGDTWRAGHDFANPPTAEYRLADTPLRNLIRHGSFDWVQWRGKLGPWTATGAKSAAIVWGKGGITQSYTTRDTIVGAGVRLSGEPVDGIEQGVEGLRPEQEYEAGVWVKLVGGARVMLSVERAGAPGVRVELGTGTQWQRLTARFTTGAEAGSATVSVIKTGSGTVFVDDVSLVGLVAGLEPRLPGFAPAAPRKQSKPAPPRHSKPLTVQQCAAPPEADGTVSAAEYPGDVVEVVDEPSRHRAAGPVCRARLGHLGGTLYVAVTVPVSQPVPADGVAKWTQTDGVEVCFAYPDKNAHHPTFVLHGFPNGSCESSTEAGASRAAADQLHGGVAYAATVGAGSWTAEWAIPLSAADIEAPAGLELLFNIGVYRRERRQWIQWGGTRGQTWRVRRAGRIRLAE